MYGVIIIGAGPAGLMAAIQASLDNKVLIIEKNATPGKKLLITGGGRCNVTNLKSNQFFLDTIGYNKKYLYSAINKFGPYDIYNFFENNNILLKEEKDNQIFPVSNKANDILQALLLNCNAEFNYSEVVIKIVSDNDNKWKIITDKGEYFCRNVVIATGGTSYKETGSTGDHMTFAEMLNQPTIELFPAETSVLLKEKFDLAGTAIDEVIIKYLKNETIGNLMFTHKGLSGTAVMKMSEHIYKNSEKNITIDLLPSYTFEELYNLIMAFDSEKLVFHFLTTLFTKKFSDYLVNKLNLNRKIKSISGNEISKLIENLKDMSFLVEQVEDIEKAYVTGGGINLNYIDTTTMESKVCKNIYFVGEALDIHGPIGGYNITLALSTGYLAGISINKK